MAWKLDLKKVNHYCTDTLCHFSCCDLCGEKIGKTDLQGSPLQQTILCQYCLTDLPLFKQSLISGNLLNWPAIHRALPNIHFDYLFALSPYLYPFNQWLAQLKYLGRFELADLFSTLLCAQWQSTHVKETLTPVDLVISVPLHIKKWQSRGYNQAHLIAKHFATQLALPYEEGLIMRVKNNDSQMGKTGSQRRKNLANAFTLTKQIAREVKHVMIIDDVVTTGTTVSEISKLLKNKGIKEVTLVTVCLTLPKA